MSHRLTRSLDRRLARGGRVRVEGLDGRGVAELMLHQPLPNDMVHQRPRLHHTRKLLSIERQLVCQAHLHQSAHASLQIRGLHEDDGLSGSLEFKLQQKQEAMLP